MTQQLSETSADSTPEQAIELARSLRPDLVIMDVKMPKVDGIAAAASIVGERIAPVVMLTAFSQRDLIEQARDAGAMAYLVKPFARHELVPAIELAVSRFAERRALEDEVASLTERPAHRDGPPHHDEGGRRGRRRRVGHAEVVGHSTSHWRSPSGCGPIKTGR